MQPQGSAACQKANRGDWFHADEIRNQTYQHNHAEIPAEQIQHGDKERQCRGHASKHSKAPSRANRFRTHRSRPLNHQRHGQRTRQFGNRKPYDFKAKKRFQPGKGKRERLRPSSKNYGLVDRVSHVTSLGKRGLSGWRRCAEKGHRFKTSPERPDRTSRGTSKSRKGRRKFCICHIF